MNAITVTYETVVADCDDSIPWYWAKFLELAAIDQLVGLPVAARVEVIWERTCEIEDHKIHISITELGVHTPEVDGPPCLYLYAPRATLKFRCENLDIAFRAVTMCYNRDPDITEKDLHHSREWGLVSSLFGGTIDEKHKILLDRKIEKDVAEAWNKESFIAGLATEPYRVGTGKFTTQFKRSEPYSATIAIERGVHNDHGTAILLEQANRRCVLTRSVYDLSDEDTFWVVMNDWASFQPKRSKPRVAPGSLFFPAEYTHVMEQYWDYLDDPTKHPDVKVDALYYAQMQQYTAAVSSMDFSDFEPQPADVAPEKSQRVAGLAALSRRCLIQDACDYWGSTQDQAQEESDTDSHCFAPAQDVHNVDACAGDSV
jgi:hypothetical protein